MIVILNNFRPTSINNLYRRKLNGKVFINSKHRVCLQHTEKLMEGGGINKTDKRLYVEFLFYLKGKRNIDVDNLLKGTIDMFNGYLWTDDNQIYCIKAEKKMMEKNNRVAIKLYDYETQELINDTVNFLDY